MTPKEPLMRCFKALLCALVLAWPLAAGAAPKKKKAEPKEADEVSLAELLGKDLARAVEEAFAAYDDAEAALRRHAQRKGGNPNPTLRQLAEVRDAYEKALARAREARVDAGESLTRDQVVVSISQSLRALDLISAGLRDDDDDRIDAGIELAGLAQADLTSIAEGGGAAEDDGGQPELGPSMGYNASYSSSQGSSTLNTDINVSVPLSPAQDIGVGGSIGVNSATGSGSYSLGGNLFTRYHFLKAFPNHPNWVPYLGAKLGYNLGYQWSGSGLNFNSTDTTTVEVGGQLGALAFVNRKTAVTLEFELSSQSSTSEPLGGSSTTSSGSSSGLRLGLRRMF